MEFTVSFKDKKPTDRRLRQVFTLFLHIFLNIRASNGITVSFVPTIVLTTLMLLIDRLYLTESIGLQSRF